MPDSKISGLTSATTPLAGTEVLPIVQSGVTKQVSVNNLTAGKAVSMSSLTVTGTSNLATTTITQDATYQLTIQPTTTTSAARVAFTNAGQTAFVGINSSAGVAYALNLTSPSYPIVFNTASEVMRIGATGNVAIGTTSLTNQLNFAGGSVVAAERAATGGGGTLTIRGGSGASGGTDVSGGALLLSGGISTGASTSYVAFFTASAGTSGTVDNTPTEKMRVDGAGNVGIGTISPGFKLDIQGTTAVDGRIFATDNATGKAKLYIRGGAANFSYETDASNATTYLFDNTNGSIANRYFAGASGYWQFYTAGSERIRITSAGELLVGKAAAGVGTDGAQFLTTGFSGVSAAGTTAFFLNRNTNDGTILEFGRNGVSAATMGLTSSALTIGTAGSERMRIGAGGSVMIGTATADGILTVVAPASTGYGSFDAATSGFANLNFKVAGTIYAYMGSANAFVTSGTASDLALRSQNNFVVATGGGTERLRITSAGNIHTPAGATTMTNGFIYIPAAAGVPTGAATAITGTVPLYYNSAGNTLYAYNTSWQAISGGLSLVSTNANGVVYLNASSQATTSTTLTYVAGTALTSDYYVANGAITGSRSQGAYAYGTLGYSDQNLLASYASSTTSYNQMILQNSNAGASASTNLIVSNNVSTASTFYGEFGMNSSGFTGTGSLSLASAVYLTATSSELVLGTTTANGLRFVVNSGATDAMRLTSAGNLGINTASPAYLLDVTTSSRVTGGLILTGLATPGAPSGAGSTTGGSLAAATYYAKVIAIDVNANGSVISAESAGVTTTGSTSSIVWTWTAVAGAASYQLYFGTTSGTGYNTYFTTATNSYTLTTTAGASTNVFGQPSASAPGNSGSIAADGNIKGFNLQAVGTNPTGGLGALLWNGSNNANAISNLLFGNDTSIVVSGIYQYPSTATNPNELRISNGTSTGALTFHTNGAKRMEFPASGPTVIYTQSNQISFNTTTLYAEFYLSTAATGNWLMLRNYGVSATGTTGGVSNAGLSCLIFNNDAPGVIAHTKTTTAYPIVVSTADAERLRVTELGNLVVAQGAQSAQNTSATLTIAQIRTGIITANAAVTLTLPTGTTLDTYCTPSMATNTAFEVTFIATAAAAITIGANGNTTVGSLTVAANTSGTYRFRKTAANTFTVYRL